MRHGACAALRMVCASAAFMCSCMDRGGGGDVGNVVRVWCVKNLRGDAQPSPYRVLFVAPGRRVWRARRRSTRLRARRCGFRRFRVCWFRATRSRSDGRHERRGRAVATRLARTVRGVGVLPISKKETDSLIRDSRRPRPLETSRNSNRHTRPNSLSTLCGQMAAREYVSDMARERQHGHLPT